LQLCRDHQIPYAERDLSLTEFHRADEVFCSGTMGELTPVVAIDGRPIGSAKPGPLTLHLSSLFHDLTTREGTPLPDPPAA
jgi:branched-chain amino acid aminotransferase